jgi:hypothetical protein
MPLFRRLICLFIGGLVLGLTVTAQAHQVPSLQIEAEFFLNRNYILRINLDPRVFLSDQPSSLPPVPASWYRDQTPEQIKNTEKAAMAYLRKNVELQFGVDRVPVPDCTFVAMDGANNKPVTEETQEVHLLATAKGTVKGSGSNFSINLGPETGVSLLLLNTMEGQSERKPRVNFPGESTDPFPLTGMEPPVTAKAILELATAQKSQARQWMWRGGICLALFVFYTLFLKKRRHRNPRLETRHWRGRGR